MQLVGQAAVEYSVNHGASIVIVSQIRPGKEAAYRAWAGPHPEAAGNVPGISRLVRAAAAAGRERLDDDPAL